MLKNKTHLILALLYAASQEENEYGKIEGITRLEKLLFIIDREARLTNWNKISDKFDFKPYLMGPFSSEIYDEIDFLESLGLIDTKKIGTKFPSESVEGKLFFSNQILDKYQKSEVIDTEETKTYELSEQGKQIAKSIFEKLPQTDKEYLIELKKKYSKMNLKQLLRYIYQKYPSFTLKSEIKEYLGIK